MRPALLVPQTGLLGGAERVLLDWSRALERPVVFACPPGPLAAGAAAAGHEVVLLPDRPLRRRGRNSRTALGLAALAGDIARLARAHRPAVVVASGVRPILAAAAAPLGGAPLVTVHHDLGPAPLLRTARGNAAIATSGAIAEAIGGARVIRPGVHPAHWAAVPDAPKGPPRALFLGVLVPWKRADLALEIAARIPDLRLDLAGTALPGDPPGYVAALGARAAQQGLAGRVRFLGAVSDPRPALAGAHCLLHCADREPFGLVLVEALAAGRPVVAPAAGGPLEIVTMRCGRLYVPGDASAGASALMAILAEPGAPAAARVRATAFDADAAAARFAAAVEAAASGPP